MSVSKIKIFLAMLAVSVTCHAGTLALVTDQADAAVANQVKDAIQKEPCFKDLHSLQIKIKVVAPSELSSCQDDPSIKRVITCKAAAPKFAAEMNADKILIIKNDPRWAGSAQLGGLSATMATGLAVRAGIHELLHTTGLADEYTYYTPDEANRYCIPPGGPNIAYFKDFPPYESDSEARIIHSGQIPWYGRITATLITTLPNLGTPEPNRIGLYKANNCALATTGVKSWRPGDSNVPTLMQSSNGIIPPSFCAPIQNAFNEPAQSGGEPDTSSTGAPSGRDSSGAATR